MTKVEINPGEKQKRSYWASQGFGLREGFRMHQLSGQLEKGPNSWRNVTQHCIVEAARVRVLGQMIGLDEDLIADAKMASFLHDFDKKWEVEAGRRARQNGQSQLQAVSEQARQGEQLLMEHNFSKRVIRLASSPGGLASELLETNRILDQAELSPEDWAYLLVHYVDDCSVESKWVSDVFASKEDSGTKVNIIDYRAEENKGKSAYQEISEEVGQDLIGTVFEGMNNHDAMTIVSHRIEQRLADRIGDRSGVAIDPFKIPELVDQRIREDILRIRDFS